MIGGICRVINIITICTTFISCRDNNCSEFETLVKKGAVGENMNYEVNLKQISELDFDKLYIFEGPRFPDEIQEVININYSEVLEDGDRLYLFVKDNSILKKEISSCKDVNIHRIMNEQGYAIFTINTVLEAKKRKNGNDLYYDVFLNN